MAEPTEATGEALPQAAARLIERARRTLLWERIWPAMVPPLMVVALFLSAAWLDLFALLPGWGRVGALVLFALALIASLAPVRALRLPARREAIARIDHDTGIPNRPLAALDDRMAGAAADPVSRALWQAHRREAARLAAAARVAPPSPGLARRDPRALRFAVLLPLVIAFFHAGDERLTRLAAPFTAPDTTLAGAPLRIDAWVTPPAYTRKPPLLVSARRAEEEPLAVPEGSAVVVRVAGDRDAGIDVEGRARDAADPAAPAPGPEVVERRVVLDGETTITVRRGGGEAAVYRFTTIEDRPPTIAVTEPVRPSLRGAMTLSYRVEDDYGVAGAEAEISRDAPPGARPLFDPPAIALALPANRKAGTASATRDVSQSPWAGADIKMTLVARDAAGQVGRSEPVAMMLPGRTFREPLARALIEQRRALALDANAAPQVLFALQALMIAPGMFTPDKGVYLGLSTARHRLEAATTDDELRGVVAYLWEIALRIEEGDLSEAEQALRAAQERLREAIERGAPEEEIRRLTQELREAMNRFLSEMARQMQRREENRNPLARSDQPMRLVTPEELNAMLDRMERAARDGAREEAEDLLSELENLLNNLQAADPSQMAEDPAMQEMQRQMQAMQDLIQRQQRLRDQTFREGRNRQDGEQGEQDGAQPGEPRAGDGAEPGDQGGMQGLQDRQEALRRQLEAMRRALESMGAEGGEALAEAEQAMRDAEGQLGEGDGEAATGSQGRAIEALRRGAQQLAQQLQEGEGQQAGRPDRGRNGRAERFGEGPAGDQDRDPLGRPTRSRSDSDGGNVRVPERGESATERASRILDELRRRLTDPTRPPLELDYIDRLLRRDGP